MARSLASIGRKTFKIRRFSVYYSDSTDHPGRGGMHTLHGVMMMASLHLGIASAANPAIPVKLVTVPIEGLTFCCQSPGKAQGALIDAVQMAMKNTGTRYSIKLVPWARAIHMARKEANTCVLGLRKTPDNEHQYQWAGPLMRSSVRILGRKAANFHARSEQELSGRSIGVLRGSAYIAQLESAGARVDQADTVSSNVRKLIAGRIDLMATSSKTVPDTTHEQSPIVELFSLEAGDAFVACHRAVDSSVVDRLNEAIFQLRNAGALHQLGL